MDTRDAFVARLKAQLDEWNAELDLLEARSRKAQADTQIAYNEHIATLQRHRDDAKQRLAQIQQATGDAWKEMTDGVEDAWACIGQAFTHARARLDELKATQPTTTSPKGAPKRAVEQCNEDSHEKRNEHTVQIPGHRAGQ